MSRCISTDTTAGIFGAALQEETRGKQKKTKTRQEHTEPIRIIHPHYCDCTKNPGEPAKVGPPGKGSGGKPEEVLYAS
jgi:hypothetical protein